MPRAGIEHATPATERPQTYALHREATGIDLRLQHSLILYVPHCNTIMFFLILCLTISQQNYNIIFMYLSYLNINYFLIS
jgi:hypothetical protein